RHAKLDTRELSPPKAALIKAAFSSLLMVRSA
ncbi:hypothetical protein ACS0TW_03665, partial [Klebsiella michiganensis]